MQKKIKGFENYLIDDRGMVFNTKTRLVKKPTSNHTGKGYLYVDLYNNGISKRFYIHRLVAEAFITNPENKPYINHKDGNPHNNCVENLEWCTPLENVEHASKVLGVMPQYKNANNKRKRKVKQIDIATKQVVNVFDSIREAEMQTGIKSSNIICVLKGRQNHTKGFTWCYVEDLGV